jgi:hypothetical protein
MILSSLLALLAFTNAAVAINSTLNLSLVSGDFSNYVLRDNDTSATLLLNTNASAQSFGYNRFLVAFPAGNSGAMTNFTALSNGTSAGNSTASNSSLAINLVNGTFASVRRDYNQSGVQGTLSFSGSALMNETVIGGVRAIRDVVEGGLQPNPLFSWNVSTANDTYIELIRLWLNQTAVPGTNETAQYGMHMVFSAKQGMSFGKPSNDSQPNFAFNKADNATAGIVDFVVTLNETSLTGLGREDVFSAPNDTVAGLESQMSFLAYSNKFLAGSWRFLTYFGRDTLFTLNLLLTNKTLSATSIEAVLSAAISRINVSSGYVCHEETIGDYATFINLQNNQSYKGNEPFYDYKMVDTHFLVLPALAEYYLLYQAGDNGTVNQTAIDAANTFLSQNSTLQNGTTFRTLLDANVQYILNISSAFANDSTAANLVRIEQNQPVGNWRDSNTGLGDGTYPLDVNIAHVPAALHAIADLAEVGILNGTLNSTRQAAQIWEAMAPTLFEVSIDQQTAEQRLQAYAANISLPDSLLYGNGSLNATMTNDVTGSNDTANVNSTALGSSISGNNTVSGNMTYYALSLTDAGQTVEVLNSDVSFALVFARNLTTDFVRRAVATLQPYPRGLLTNVGNLIANPAYDGNATNAAEFTFRDYHGTVVWGFAQGFMAKGLARLQAACKTNQTAEDRLLVAKLPRLSYCDDTEVMQSITEAQVLLWQGINGAGESNKYSELWSQEFNNVTNKFDVVPFGSVATTKTEADAIQLWSYGFLALTPV